MRRVRQRAEGHEVHFVFPKEQLELGCCITAPTCFITCEESRSAMATLCINIKHASVPGYQPHTYDCGWVSNPPCYRQLGVGAASGCMIDTPKFTAVQAPVGAGIHLCLSFMQVEAINTPLRLPMQDGLCLGAEREKVRRIWHAVEPSSRRNRWNRSVSSHNLVSR